MIYAGAPSSPETAARVSQMVALLPVGAPVLSPAEQLDDLISHDQLTVVGSDEVHHCLGQELDAGAYRTLLDEFYRAIWETESLDPLLAQLRGAQACLKEPVESHDLARVAFLDGVMAFELGDEERARSALTEALVMAPSYLYEEDFGPPAGRLFEELRSEVSAVQRIPVQVVGVGVTRVWVDGELADGPNADAPPGRHVLQVSDRLGDTWTTVVEVGAGKPVTLVDPRGLEHASPDAMLTVVSDLLAALHAQGPAPAWFVLLGEPVRAWQWDGDALDEVRVTRAARQALAPPEPTSRKKLEPGAAVLLTSGIGLAVAGGIVSIAANVDLRSFNEAVDVGEIDFPEDIDPDRDSHPNYIKWREKSQRVYVGYGLLGAGGACLLVSIPVQHLSRGSSQRLALALQPLGAPIPGGFELEGLRITLSLF